MEKESTSTWAFLNKSGEIVNVEADLGSGSESSIEFIRDETVHYERNNNHRSSAEPEVKEDSQDVAATATSSEVLALDGATAADDDDGGVTAVKDEEGGGEISRSELTLENITSTDANASVSPNSTSPVSPSSSDDSSGSVTLLEGRFSDGDLDTFPEDFWFDSDFELLDQHSSSDLAHLQLAAGVANNTSPATHRPKFNFKLKKQVPLFSGMGISETETETESVNVSDADDESSTNVELCSSIEESEVASIGPVDEVPPVKNLGSLAPVPPNLPVPTLALKPPRMSVTFLMLASLVIGLLIGITTKYSLDPYSSEQLSEDIAEMQRINEMHLLKEENDHMRKYVDSLKWRMNSLQNSNKQQLSDELRQVNQLLKGRIDELDQQILTVQHEIFEAKSGVKPPIISDTGNQHIPADNLQDINEPIANNDPELETEISNHVDAASHDDIIQIHSSHEELALKEGQGVHHEEEESQGVQIHSSHDELALEENQDVQIDFSPEEEGESQGVEIPSSHKELFLEESQDSTEQMSSVSLIDIPSNDAPSISTDDEIIKSESKADDTFIALHTKLEEEKKRADNLEKLYAELKQLVDSRKQATDSSVETVEGAKAKRAKETVRYCSPLDKDCTMDWLNQEVMLHLITSVMAEIPPQAQQWKEYMAQKFQSVLDPQVEQDPNMEADESEMGSNFQFKKLNIYMNRMLDQMNSAKDDLQTRFEKTLLKIKKGTSKFWEKAVERNENEMKKSAGRKKGEDLADSEGSQDSNLQLIENSIDDTNKEYKIQKTEKFGQLQKGELENDNEVKIRSNENKKHHHHHRSDERKKNKDKKRSENKDKKHKSKFDKKNGPEKSEEEKKYQSAKSQSEEKKHQEKFDGDDKKHRQHKSDNKDKKRKYDEDEEEEHHPSKFHDDDDDIKHTSHKSDDKKKHKAQKLDNEDKKRRYKDDDKEHRLHNDDDDDDDDSESSKKHKSHRSNDKKDQLKKNKHQHKIDDNKKSKKKLQHNENEKNEDTTKKSKKKLRHNENEKNDDTTKKSKKKLRHNENEKNDDTTKKSKKKLRRNEKNLDDTKKSKRKLRPNKKESDDTTKSKKWQHKENKIDDTTKSKKKFRHHEKKLRPTTKSAPYEKENRNANEYRDNKKSLKDERKLKIDKKSKDNFKMKAQSKESCDQLSVNLEDSISTISKEKFRRMNVKTILRMSKKLSNFNKQCKHFSSNIVKEWSACQQMWWTLCGQRGFLPGQLQNSKCQHYLLGWQLLAAASPEGGGKPGCDDCGCQNKPGKQKEDRQNATNSDSAFENIKEEEKKVMSGEWYFKHKTVPAEKSGEWYFKHKTVPAEKNNEQDCDENKFQCSTADLWDEMENEKRQHMDKMLNAEFHRLNHYNHVHRRRCRDYNNHINCYNWFHPTYVGKWASVYYQNLMNIMQKWQK